MLDHLILSHSLFDQLDPKCSGMFFPSPSSPTLAVPFLILNVNLSNISVSVQIRLETSKSYTRHAYYLLYELKQ